MFCARALSQNIYNQEVSTIQSTHRQLDIKNFLIAMSENPGGRIGGGKFSSELENKQSDQSKKPKRGLFPITFKVASPELSILRGSTLLRVNFYLKEQAQNNLDRVNSYGEEQISSSALKYYQEGIEKIKQIGSLELLRESVKDFSDALKKDGNFSEAYVGRGIAYSELASDSGQESRYYYRAIEDFTTALSVQPKFSSDSKRYVEPLLGRGTIYVRLGDTEKALEDFTEALERNSNFYDAYLSRANVYEEKGEYLKAIDDLNKALDLNLDYPAAYLALGHIRNQMGDYEKAIVDLQNVINSDEKDAIYYTPQAFFEKGISNLNLGNANKAIADFSTSIKAVNQVSEEADLRLSCARISCADISGDVFYQLGIAYDSLGKTSDAVNAYSNSLRSGSSHTAEALYKRGFNYLGVGENDKAISDFTDLIEMKNEDFLEAIYYRGLAHLQNQDFSLALIDLNQMINSDSTFVEAYIARGRTHFFLGDKSQAEEDFKRAMSKLEELEKHPELDVYYGDLYYSEELYENAINSYRRSISLDQKSAQAYLGIGKVKYQLKEYLESISAINQAIQLTSSELSDSDKQKRHFCDAYYTRGLSYQGMNKFKEALKDFEEASSCIFSNSPLNRAVDFSSTDISFHKGEVEFFLNDYLSSARDLSHVIKEQHKKYEREKNSVYDLAYYYSGVSNYRLGKYSESKEYLESFLELQPEFSEVHFIHYLLGSIELNLHRYQKAIEHSNDSLNLEPGYSKAYILRGTAKLQMNDYQGAINDFDKLIELGAEINLSEIRLLRGKAYYYLDQKRAYEKAVDDFNFVFNSSIKNRLESLLLKSKSYYKLKQYSTNSSGSKGKEIDINSAPEIEIENFIKKTIQTVSEGSKRISEDLM
jgi:tetratricopeptide (TPR) repeat protein